MVKTPKKKRILVAPLNWGLGHATRCIPLIKALLVQKFEPLIASDGNALELLRKEFPQLQYIELPSYGISYPKQGKYFKLKFLQNTPHIINAIKSEKKVITSLVASHGIRGIISDNRLGVYHKSIPSVYLTHQLNVLSGNTTWLSSKLHQNIIRQFEECWVPDHSGKINLSGKLGHETDLNIPVKYIGPISRFTKEERPIKYDVLVLLSGPEPQRTLLETKLLADFKHFNGKVVFVKGQIEREQHISEEHSLSIYNYMTSEQLQDTINESIMVVARSGYTSILDLAKLEKKVFFIPTPGQFEQEYLAKHLKALGHAPHCNQNEFNIEKLAEVDNYNGMSGCNTTVDFGDLFSLFECE